MLTRLEQPSCQLAHALPATGAPRAQAMARVWRDGQKRPCTVYRLLTTGAPPGRGRGRVRACDRLPDHACSPCTTSCGPRHGRKRPCTVYRLLTTGASPVSGRGCVRRCPLRSQVMHAAPATTTRARACAPRHAGREGVPAPAHEGRAGGRHGGAAAAPPASGSAQTCLQVLAVAAPPPQGRSGRHNRRTLEPGACAAGGSMAAAGDFKWRPCAGRGQAHRQGGGLHARRAAPALQPGREHAVRDGRPAAPRRAGGRLGGARSLRRAH